MSIEVNNRSREGGRRTPWRASPSAHAPKLHQIPPRNTRWV